MLESQIQIHPTMAQPKLEDVSNERRFVEFGSNLAAREVRLIWLVLPGASTIQIKKDNQEYLNGQTPESTDETIIVISVFYESKTTLLIPHDVERP